MSKLHVSVWRREFSDGREEIRFDRRPGRPISEPDTSVGKVRILARNDRCVTARELSTNTGTV
jgi:hypothetical protein